MPGVFFGGGNNPRGLKWAKNKKTAGCLDFFEGMMKYYPVMWQAFQEPGNNDPVIKQPVFNGNYLGNLL